MFDCLHLFIHSYSFLTNQKAILDLMILACPFLYLGKNLTYAKNLKEISCDLKEMPLPYILLKLLFKPREHKNHAFLH